MCANADRNAALRKLARFPSGIVINKSPIGRLRSPCSTSRQNARRRMHQQRIVEHIGCLPPIRISCQTAIGYRQCRRVIGLARSKKLQNVLIHDINRDIVLHSGIAIGNHVHIHAEQRPTLGHNQHVLSPRSSDHLLTLFAAWLVVILHRHPTLRLDPPHMGQRIVIGVNPSINTGRFGPIDNLASREDARRKGQASALALSSGKDHAGAVGWVVDRRHSHRQILHR